MKNFQIPSSKNIQSICEQQMRVYVIKCIEGARVRKVQRVCWKSTLRACTDFSQTQAKLKLAETQLLHLGYKQIPRNRALLQESDFRCIVQHLAVRSGTGTLLSKQSEESGRKWMKNCLERKGNSLLKVSRQRVERISYQRKLHCSSVFLSLQWRISVMFYPDYPTVIKSAPQLYIINVENSGCEGRMKNVSFSTGPT